MQDRCRAEEADGELHFLKPYGFGKTKQKRAPKLTSATVRRRAKGDPVTEELIAALMPSFKDGDCGPEGSDYKEDDPRRVEWPHNILSLKAVAHPSGVVYRQGDAVEHVADPAELESMPPARRGGGEAAGGAGMFRRRAVRRLSPLLPDGAAGSGLVR